MNIKVSALRGGGCIIGVGQSILEIYCSNYTMRFCAFSQFEVHAECSRLDN